MFAFKKNECGVSYVLNYRLLSFHCQNLRADRKLEFGDISQALFPRNYFGGFFSHSIRIKILVRLRHMG